MIKLYTYITCRISWGYNNFLKKGILQNKSGCLVHPKHKIELRKLD